MNSEVGTNERAIVFRTRVAHPVWRLAGCAVLLLAAILLLTGPGNSADLIAGVYTLGAFAGGLWLTIWLFRSPPRVILDHSGLRARPGIVRLAEPIPWDAINGFEIVRRRPGPLLRPGRFLGVHVLDPTLPRWQTRSSRTINARFRAPFVIPEGLLAVRLEEVVDAARAFTDAPLTYADDAARQPRERWRAARQA